MVLHEEALARGRGLFPLKAHLSQACNPCPKMFNLRLNGDTAALQNSSQVLELQALCRLAPWHAKVPVRYCHDDRQLQHSAWKKAGQQAGQLTVQAPGSTIAAASCKLKLRL